MTTEERRLHNNETTRKWRAANPEKDKETQRRNREKNGHRWKTKNNARAAKWRIDNAEYAKARELEYRKKHRAEACAREKARRLDNPEQKREADKEYRKKNTKILTQKCIARRNRDIHFKLAGNLRSRLRVAIKQENRGGSAVRDLGCSIQELTSYIASKFLPGMTWENWSLSGWHIDHIIPLTAFDLTDNAQCATACHFSNLQPLWAADNIRKYNKIL